MNALELIRGLFVVLVIACGGWGWIMYLDARDALEWTRNTLRGEIARSLNAKSVEDLKREVRERWPEIVSGGML